MPHPVATLREIGWHDPDDVCPADGALRAGAHDLDRAVRAQADVAALQENHLARVREAHLKLQRNFIMIFLISTEFPI